MMRRGRRRREGRNIRRRRRRCRHRLKIILGMSSRTIESVHKFQQLTIEARREKRKTKAQQTPVTVKLQHNNPNQTKPTQNKTQPNKHLAHLYYSRYPIPKPFQNNNTRHVHLCVSLSSSSSFYPTSTHTHTHTHATPQEVTRSLFILENILRIQIVVGKQQHQQQQQQRVSKMGSKMSKFWTGMYKLNNSVDVVDDGECRSGMIKLSNFVDVVDDRNGFAFRGEKLLFRVHEFEHRKEKFGEYFITATGRAHGAEWCLHVYPRGKENPNDGYVSLFLVNKGKESVTLNFEFKCHTHITYAKQHEFMSNRGHGWTEFLKRSEVLDKSKGYLDDVGTLDVEVTIEPYVEKNSIWYPKLLESNPFTTDLFNSRDDTGDVVFDVKGKHFKAHKNVLSFRAGTLASMADDSESGIVQIDGISQEDFDILVKWIYAVLEPSQIDEIGKDRNKVTNILLAADKYECVGLKLLSESVLADKFLTKESAVNILIFADGHSCPLLKEAAVKIIIKNAADIMLSEDWNLVGESNNLKEEIKMYLKGEFPDEEKEFKDCSISDLRRLLENINLEIEGDRKMLVDRLKRYNNSVTNK